MFPCSDIQKILTVAFTASLVEHDTKINYKIMVFSKGLRDFRVSLTAASLLGSNGSIEVAKKVIDFHCTFSPLAEIKIIEKEDKDTNLEVYKQHAKL